MRPVVRLFIVFLTFYTLSCNKVTCRGGTASEAANTFTFDSEEENSWQIKVKANSRITLRILGNPTTGYEWQLNRGNLNDQFLKPVKLASNNIGRFEEPDVPFGFVGAPGYYIFQFDVLKTGNTNIEFKYKRPWETEVARTLKTNLEIVE